MQIKRERAKRSDEKKCGSNMSRCQTKTKTTTKISHGPSNESIKTPTLTIIIHECVAHNLPKFIVLRVVCGGSRTISLLLLLQFFFPSYSFFLVHLNRHVKTRFSLSPSRYCHSFSIVVLSSQPFSLFFPTTI